MRKIGLEESQAVSLGILKRVADICDKKGLKYSLAYGTLLGAIRHKDFIPWDDDIDIWMPRPDYELLLSYSETHAEELAPLQVFNQKTCSKYPYMITRISDSRYVLDVKNEANYGIGVFIDIYVLDGFGSDLLQAQKMASIAKKNASLLFLATRLYYHFGTTKGFKKRLLKMPAFIYAKLRGKKFFIQNIEALIAQNDYNSSDYIGCICWCVNEVREIFKKNQFENLQKCKFGRYEFNIISDYDIILRQIYNDYMQLPPLEDRIPHHLYDTYEK